MHQMIGGGRHLFSIIITCTISSNFVNTSAFTALHAKMIPIAPRPTVDGGRGDEASVEISVGRGLVGAQGGEDLGRGEVEGVEVVG
jgi:hypothetical protein